MKILLILATATTILTTAAHRPASPVDRRVARSHGAAPDLVRDAVRHAVGFDRLAPLLARPR
jgi:hypothetical protein